LESYRRRPKRKRDYRIYTNIRGIKCAWCHSLLTKRADYRAKNNFCSATCYQKNRKSKVNKLSAEVHALRKIAGNVRQEKYEKQQ
jgi:hypothetical protein